MRYKKRSDSAFGTHPDKSQSFMMRRVIVYLDRLLSHYRRLNSELLETIHWVLGPEIVEEELPDLASLIEDRLKKKSKERLLEEVLDAGDFASLIEKALKTSRSSLERPLLDLLRDLLTERLRELDYSGESDVERNLGLFQKMFGLNDVETELILFFCIFELWEELGDLFGYGLKCDQYVGRDYLATILNCRSSEIGQAISGRLSKIGIIDPDRRSIEIESEFSRLLLDANGTDLDTHFFKKIDPHVLPLDAHGIDPEITEHALRLLSPENERGNSLLLYGFPGVGKTTFAFGLGKELGLDIFLCKHEGKRREWERQAAVVSSVNMSSENPNTLVIIDDCDSIIGTSHLWSLFGSYNDKKWLHDVLESNARLIFIVNDIRFIEESVIRRFSYSISFKAFGRRQRVSLWKNILENHNVGDALTEREIEDFATRYDTTPGVIEQAVGRAAETALLPGADLHSSITLSLEAYETLRYRGRSHNRRRQTFDKNFTLEGLNVVGADLPDLLEELEVFNEFLKSGETDEICTMSLLFHGYSGTGKSHLARHIGHVLDREVVFKKGSDLLNKYIGETEQNIRSTYEEAESKEAVLIIDEADSLIFNRDRAERSWELSFTNEFLNCMENYRGIQIYTTNRLTDLDAASLRRFNYKLEFDFLKPEGKIIFYKRLLAPLVLSTLDVTLKKELMSIPNLAPGDFKVVRSKFRFKGKDKVSHKALVAALKEESKTKDVYGGKKVIGF